jgi:hypothetical protein
MRSLTFAFFSALILGACCTAQKARPVLLSDVISDLRTQLAKIEAQCARDQSKCKSGQLLSEVDVTLAVTTVSETDNSISVSLPVGSATLGGTSGTKVTDTSANTILLKFTSPLFAPLTTPIGKKLDVCGNTEYAKKHAEICDETQLIGGTELRDARSGTPYVQMPDQRIPDKNLKSQ